MKLAGRRWRPGLVVGLLALATPLSAEDGAEVVLDADPVPLTSVQLKRGGPVPVRVSLGFDRALLLNLAPAEAAGLKPFPIFGKFRAKNPQLPGGEALIRGNLAQADVGGTGKQRLPTVWIDKDVAAAPQQGIVSVFALRADRVRIRVAGAPTGATRQYLIERAGEGDSDARWRVGGEEIRLVLDLTAERTVLNARAAAALERAGLVRRLGRVETWSPVPALALPVERLAAMAGAQSLGGLPLGEPMARITRARAEALDAEAARQIAGLSEEADAEEAIVVSAEKEGRGAPRNRAPWMLVGRDVLGFCPEILLDRPGRRWVLQCAFPAAAPAG